MKRVFKFLFVFIAASLCVLAATLCGCSAKAEYVEGSFRITSVEDYSSYSKELRIDYEYKLSANKAGLYKIEFRADYGNNLSDTFSDTVEFSKGDVATATNAALLDNAKGLKASDIKVTVLRVWLENSYSDDSAYFAIGLVFGVAAIGALAVGITIFVFDYKERRGRISATAGNAEGCGEEAPQPQVDGQEDKKDAD